MSILLHLTVLTRSFTACMDLWNDLFIKVARDRAVSELQSFADIIRSVFFHICVECGRKSAEFCKTE